MKLQLTIVLTFILFHSCAITRTTIIQKKEYDIFANESLKRISPDRRLLLLQNEKNKHLTNIINCYDNNIKKSLKNFKKDLNKHENDFEYWNQIGICYLQKNDLKKAKTFFSISLQMSNQKKEINYSALNNIGIIQYRQKNYPAAKKSFIEASRVNRTLVPIYNLSQLYLKFSLYSDAIKLLQSLYNINKSDLDILSSLATAHLLNNQLILATKFFKEIEKANTEYLKKGHISVFYALALYYSGDYKQAKDILEDQQDLTKKQTQASKSILKLIKEKLKERS